MSRFRPGDVVLFTRDVGGAEFKPVEGVIAFENCPMPCMVCDDPDCVEWGNVLGLDGKWYWHVPECAMQLSGLGKALRLAATP
ncbi:MAG: hypothetical protein AB1760_00005 [Pseudomonadota bacterium]